MVGRTDYNTSCVPRAFSHRELCKARKAVAVSRRGRATTEQDTTQLRATTEQDTTQLRVGQAAAKPSRYPRLPSKNAENWHRIRGDQGQEYCAKPERAAHGHRERQSELNRPMRKTKSRERRECRCRQRVNRNVWTEPVRRMHKSRNHRGVR